MSETAMGLPRSADVSSVHQGSRRRLAAAGVILYAPQACCRPECGGEGAAGPHRGMHLSAFASCSKRVRRRREADGRPAPRAHRHRRACRPFRPIAIMNGGGNEAVRRDHDAGLPAVDEGHTFRASRGWICSRACSATSTDEHDVHDGGRRRRRRCRLQSGESVGTQVAGPAGQRPGEDRHQGSAHFQQRAVRPRGLRIPGSRRADAKAASPWPSAGSRAARCSA